MVRISYPSWLGVLLHNESHSVHQLRRGDRLMIHKVVVLHWANDLRSSLFKVHEQPEPFFWLCEWEACSQGPSRCTPSQCCPWSVMIHNCTCMLIQFWLCNSRTGKENSKGGMIDVQYLFNFVSGVVLKQNGLVLLLCGKDAAIHRLNQHR